MQPIQWTLVTVIAGSLAVAPAWNAEVPSEPARQRMSMGRGMLELEQAQVAVADVEGGVALTFETASGGLEEIRSRVRFMADMINENRTAPGRGPRGRGMVSGLSAQAAATVEDIPEGARLVLEPANDSDLAALRDQARRLAERIEASGSTTMAGMMMAGPLHRGDVVLTAMDTTGGVALTFTTGTGDVAGLQNRVERMAQMFDTGRTSRGRGGRGMMAGRGMMIEATASVERLPDGARLTLEAAEATQLDQLRRHVKRMAEMMTR